jgi:hypothetical protein
LENFMADYDEFSPDALRIEAQNSERVRLVWGRDNGERRVVVLDRAQLPAVARELQKQIEDGTAIAVNVGALLAETEARVAGLGFSPEPDHFRLTVYVDVPEQAQGLEISLRFSKAELVECVTAMVDWLERSGNEG